MLNYHVILQRYLSAILGPIYDLYGYNDLFADNHVTRILKMHVRKWACEMGVSDCEQNAVDFVPKWNMSFVKLVFNFPNHQNFTNVIIRSFEKSPTIYQ